MLLDVNSFKKGDLYVSFKTVEEFKKGITILETYGFKFSGNEETIYLVEEKITKDPRNRVFFKTYEGNKFYYAALNLLWLKSQDSWELFSSKKIFTKLSR